MTVLLKYIFTPSHPKSRGFVFGAAVAAKLNCGFVLVRKPGKLPREAYQETYELEYGMDTLEMHMDALNENDRVLIVDDLIAFDVSNFPFCSKLNTVVQLKPLPAGLRGRQGIKFLW